MMGWEDALKKESATSSDLDEASNNRLTDARCLIAAGRSASAIAAGLYALEIRLKVLICRRLDLTSLPKAFEFHDLGALLILTGLKNQLEDPTKSGIKTNWANILVTAGQLNALRYSPERLWPLAQAVTFLDWLENPTDGVLPWLSSQP